MNSNKIRAAIIEDERPAARLLSGMISALRPEWEIEMLPGNIAGAVQWFATHDHPDILFLDIHLSDGNSFLFIEQARPQSVIIFTTAYDEYAVRAFTVNSIDYLLKPIHQERLEEAILKYETFSNQYFNKFNEQNDMLDILRSLSSPDKKFRTRFLVMAPNRYYTLMVEDIAFFYTEDKVTFAVTNAGQEHVIDLTLDKLTEQLDPDMFFRANRQVILHVKSIVKIEPYFQNKIVVHTKPEFRDQILVSREKATAFKLWLNY